MKGKRKSKKDKLREAGRCVTGPYAQVVAEGGPPGADGAAHHLGTRHMG